MSVGKFAKKTAKKPAPAQGKPKKKSKWAGVTSSQPKDPIPYKGLYRFRVEECEEGYNEGKGTTSFKLKLTIAALEEGNDKHAEGDTVVVPWVIDGNKSAMRNRERVKDFVVKAAGCENDPEFDELDPDGFFIPTLTGEATDFADAGITLIGRFVDCEVQRGNDVKGEDGTPTGDYYREYKWSVVPEDEQEVANMATQIAEAE